MKSVIVTLHCYVLQQIFCKSTFVLGGKAKAILMDIIMCPSGIRTLSATIADAVKK